MDDLQLLEDALDSLERTGCQFFACEGPTLPPIDMVTCHVCALIARLRRRLGRRPRTGCMTRERTRVDDRREL